MRHGKRKCSLSSGHDASHRVLRRGIISSDWSWIEARSQAFVSTLILSLHSNPPAIEIMLPPRMRWGAIGNKLWMPSTSDSRGNKIPALIAKRERLPIACQRYVPDPLASSLRSYYLEVLPSQQRFAENLNAWVFEGCCGSKLQHLPCREKIGAGKMAQLVKS